MEKPKIYRFDEFVNERLFNSNVARAKTGVVRKEEGTRVRTAWGPYVVLENPDYDVNNLIRDFAEAVGYEDGPFYTDFDYLHELKPEYQKATIEGRVQDCGCVICNRSTREPIVFSFPIWQELKDETTVLDNDDVTEKDYYAIATCIAEELKRYDIVKAKPEPGKSFGEWRFLLLGESDTAQVDMEISENYPDYYEDFKNEFESKFDSRLVTWQYNDYGYNIGLVIEYDSFLEYFDCLKYAQEYFKSLYDNRDEYAYKEEDDEFEEEEDYGEEL